MPVKTGFLSLESAWGFNVPSLILQDMYVGWKVQTAQNFRRNVVEHFGIFDDDDAVVSESAVYRTWETSFNYSNPFSINYVTQETGSSISMSAALQNYETDFGYSNPFGKGPYQNTGSVLAITTEYSTSCNK